jgi:hypothetical protein
MWWLFQVLIMTLIIGSNGTASRIRGRFAMLRPHAHLTPDLADKGPGISVCSLLAIISWNENRQRRTECGCIAIPHPGRD